MLSMAAGNHDQQNQTNTLREHQMESTIETVLSNQEQSYEDFMGCFVALKKEDVLAHQSLVVQRTLNQMQVNKTTEGQSSETEASENPLRQFNIEEEIEIEELDEGHYAPARKSTDVSTGHKFVQVDNFVDDAELSDIDVQEEDKNEDELEASHYESSFCLIEDSSTSPLKLSKDIMRRVEGDKDGDSSAMHLDLRGVEMRTLPGEAEEEERDGRSSSLSDDAIHRTQLKMSTAMRQDEAESTTKKTQSEINLEISSDDVQPFSLDKDFDYDNVVLTPKWDSNHTPPGWKPGC